MTCLLYWLTGFRGEDLKTFFPIGSYVKTTVCPLKVAILDGGQGPGSHVGFPIGTKNKNLVYDHPMNISAKFGSNLFVVSEKKMKM